MIDRIGLVYVEIETELSRHIWLSVVYDENQMGEQHNRLDRVPTLTKKKKKS